jgi:protein-S-isoprenylcysteine O-methyltransferase Ste14
VQILERGGIADAGPQRARLSARRKEADAGERHRERGELDVVERIAHARRDAAVDVADEPQREMELVHALPPRAGHPAAQQIEVLIDVLGQIDPHEDPRHASMLSQATMPMALRLALPCAAMLAVLALAAGDLAIWRFWAWVVVMWTSAAITFARLARDSPELLAERLRPPSDRDRATRRLVALPFTAMLVLAGLDARYGWSEMPLALVLAGLALEALGFLVVGWVLLTNPFASSAVRIQEERGHQVITTGPYALVRHPMYLAVALVCLGSGPALGSWWAGLALVPVLAIFVRRTVIEDRMLHRELAGYADYAAQVRWRVVPGVF